MTTDRWKAKAAGEKHYFTGRPCKRGHVAPRFVSCGICVECNKLSSAEYLVTNRADVSRRRKESYAGVRDANIARSAAWREANPDRNKQSFERWYSKNKNRVSATVRNWEQQNPEKVRGYRATSDRKRSDQRRVDVRNRRARLKTSGVHTVDDIRAIARAQQNRCAYCRVSLQRATPHVDHIVPVARQGRNDRRNLQLLCSDCNVRKGAKDPIVFAQSLGMLI